MNNVLIDNWSIENIIPDLNDTNKLLNNKAFQDLLETIVLWDNVYFPDNEYSGYWRYMSQGTNFEHYITGCEDQNEFFEFSNFLYNKCHNNQYTKNLACGAIRYSLVAENLGYDYMPCEARAEFLYQNGIYNLIQEERQTQINSTISNPIIRKDFCEPINYEVKSYFNEFNKFYGKDVFELKLPVLANYIINSKPQGISYLEYAKTLKNSLAVKNFLKYLTNMEKEISKGNFVSYSLFTRDIEELVRDICKMDRKLVVSIDASIIPKPNLNFDVFKIRKLNFSFLKKIIKYSINGVL